MPVHITISSINEVGHQCRSKVTRNFQEASTSSDSPRWHAQHHVNLAPAQPRWFFYVLCCIALPSMPPMDTQTQLLSTFQGGLFARSLVETCAGIKVSSVISIGGPQNGVFGMLPTVHVADMHNRIASPHHDGFPPNRLIRPLSDSNHTQITQGCHTVPGPRGFARQFALFSTLVPTIRSSRRGSCR